jgi:hypothetical protein
MIVIACFEFTEEIALLPMFSLCPVPDHFLGNSHRGAQAGFGPMNGLSEPGMAN